MNLCGVADALGRALCDLEFGPPVAHVYNPLVYARAPHHQYLTRYGSGHREVVFLGMNPGPWGMMQTGVPFGEVKLVREWLRIDAPIDRPAREHPKRPIQGYGCTRSEVSGARLWGWARATFGSPENFFERFFVANYCPLVFLEEGGANLTPDKLPVSQRRPLLELCDRSLRATMECLNPRWVIGVGKFAEHRAMQALRGMDIRIGHVIHPSPASPTANRGWPGQMTRCLQGYGIMEGYLDTEEKQE